MKNRPQRARARLAEGPPSRRPPKAHRADRPLRSQPAAGELARLFAQSLDPLCIAGFDGYFKYLNPAWTALLGYDLGELKTRPFLDFVHPDDRAATRSELAKLTQGADTILFENRYRHRDGSYRWLQWNARPARGHGHIYATARDVTRQKRLEREILQIVDRERERLGREVHDGLCQTLAGIAALSSTLAARLASRSDSDSATAGEIARLLHAAMDEARNLAHGLGPIPLEAGGLDGALHGLARSVEHLFRVGCTLEPGASLPRLGLESEAHLFRITQEAIHNAITHGQSRRIEIRLGRRGGRGLLQIHSDGAPMPERAPHADSTGLHTMAYRARLIGGALEVRARGPRGTVVACTFPLPKTAGAARKTARARKDG